MPVLTTLCFVCYVTCYVTQAESSMTPSKCSITPRRRYKEHPVLNNNMVIRHHLGISRNVIKHHVGISYIEVEVIQG